VDIIAGNSKENPVLLRDW